MKEITHQNDPKLDIMKVLSEGFNKIIIAFVQEFDGKIPRHEIYNIIGNVASNVLISHIVNITKDRQSCLYEFDKITKNLRDGICANYSGYRDIINNLNKSLH